MSWLSEQFKKSKAKGTGIYSWAGSGKATTVLATVGSVIPGVGTAVGTAIGASLDLFVDGTSGNPKKNKNESANQIAHMLGQQFATKGQSGYQTLWINSTE